MAPVLEEDLRMDKALAPCRRVLDAVVRPAAEAAEAAGSTSGGVDDDCALDTFVVAMNSIRSRPCSRRKWMIKSRPTKSVHDLHPPKVNVHPTSLPQGRFMSTRTK